MPIHRSSEIGRVPIADGPGSYLPLGQVPATITSEVEGIHQLLAPAVRWVFGTNIRLGELPQSGAWAGPPENLVVIDPFQDTNPQTAAEMAIATTIHECAHALLTPPAQEQFEISFRNRLPEKYHQLYTSFVNVLEDERIETIVVQRWPELKPAIRKRWDRYLERLGPQIESERVFQQYNELGLEWVVKWEYLNKMAEIAGWEDDSGTPLNEGLLAVLSYLRGLKANAPDVEDPETVPKMGFELVTFGLG
jgi:hypothetical protein